MTFFHKIVQLNEDIPRKYLFTSKKSRKKIFFVFVIVFIFLFIAIAFLFYILNTKVSNFSNVNLQFLGLLFVFLVLLDFFIRFNTLALKLAKVLTQNIKASEERYKTLIKNTPDVIWMADTSGNIVFISDNIESIYGVDKEKIYENTEKYWYSRIHPSDYKKVKKSYSKLFKEDFFREIEYRIKGKNNEYVWVYEKAGSKTNKSGIRYIHGVYIDITDRKDSQKALKKSQHLYKLLTENSLELITLNDIDQNFLYTSPSITKITGYTEEEVKGTSLFDYIHPEDYHHFKFTAHRKVLNKSTPEPIEYRFKKKNGDYVWLETVLQPVIKDGKVVRITEASRNIDTRIDVEKSQERLAAVVENTTDFVIILDKSLKLLYANKSVRKLCKLNKDSDISSIKVSDIFEKESLKNLKEEGLLEAKRNKYWKSDARLISHKKKEIPVSQVVVAPKFKDGNFDFYSIIARDITEFKKLEQSKTDFLSIAAHELRTPLGSNRWNLEIILKELEEVPEIINDIAKENHKNLIHMLTLVNDLLSITRIDQGRVKDNPTSLDVVKTIDEILTQLKPQLSKKDIKLVKRVKDKNIPTIDLDKERFFTVVNNLLTNAVKYNKKGGKIGVVISKQKESVLIEIADSGVGIPEKDQTNIFSKFYRAKNVRDTQIEGSGLGLFVVKSFVEAWGGTINFKSKENKGTVFKVLIPFEPKKNTYNKNINKVPLQIS